MPSRTAFLRLPGLTRAARLGQRSLLCAAVLAALGAAAAAGPGQAQTLSLIHI